MRRVFLIFLSALILLLSACSTGGKRLSTEDLSLAFSCRARVSCRGDDYLCSFIRTGPASASLEILSGNGAGLKYMWVGDGFTETYRGLSAQSGACILPDGAFPRLLKEAIDCAAKPDALMAEGANSFSGVVRGSLFHLEADGNTGMPINLSVPDWEMEAVFSDCVEPAVAEASAFQ
jgi:hypothetical protein